MSPVTKTHFLNIVQIRSNRIASVQLAIPKRTLDVGLFKTFGEIKKLIRNSRFKIDHFFDFQFISIPTTCLPIKAHSGQLVWVRDEVFRGSSR